MPPELIGEWAHRTDYCGKGGGDTSHKLYIDRLGWNEQGEESGRCDLKTILRSHEYYKTWTAEFSCSGGEIPGKVTERYILHMGEFEDESGELLVVVGSTYAINVFRRCKR